ncbi:RNA binding motif protein 12Bb [Stigmatopora argus]
MAVVIRLQGLRITAGSQDIRKFFTGLKIPDGGVHIIGGEREEAFIIFASDEDARRAMTRSGGQIKGGQVSLLLSSKTEMQNVLEISTKNAEKNQRNRSDDKSRHARRSAEADGNKRSAGRADLSPPPRQKRLLSKESPCVFLKGLPFSVSERDITDFFSDLHIIDIILLRNRVGRINGMALVKFSNPEEVGEAMKRNKGYIGSRYVEICPTSERDWDRTAERLHPAGENPGGDQFERRGSPPRGQKNFQYHMRSQSPDGQRVSSSSNDGYCVMMENVSFAVETEDVKRFFGDARLYDDQIMFTNPDGNKNRCAFVLFKTLREYREALDQEAKSFFNRLVHVRPVSREKMIAIMKSQNVHDGPSGNARRMNDRNPTRPRDHPDSERCVLLQNLPRDVRKVEVVDFFGMNVSEEDVHLLRDNAGMGTSKALVLFPSEAEAHRSLSLDGQRFLGTVVALRCISRGQMRELLDGPQAAPGPQRRFNEFQGAGDGDYANFRGSESGKMPMNAGAASHGGYNSYDEPYQSRNGARGSGGPPTLVKLFNLPFQITTEEIYDFCHGYRIIQGSISLQYDRSGDFRGTASVLFETPQEASVAMQELNGRPIGARKIQLLMCESDFGGLKPDGDLLF